MYITYIYRVLVKLKDMNTIKKASEVSRLFGEYMILKNKIPICNIAAENNIPYCITKEKIEHEMDKILTKLEVYLK